LQAADTGYVFGAFTAVPWPNRPADGSPPVNVPDPSGSSFLFSLINKYKRPFRLPLVDRSSAIYMDSSDGPAFGGYAEDAHGKTVKFPNLVMMSRGKAAHDRDGNFSNRHDGRATYQLDASEGAPPAGFKLDPTTLAGTECFGAAEMEVYLLGD
jgi:hypothetical protein